MSKQVEIKIGDIPNGWSEEAADFFNKLLIRKPEYRLGYKGYKEIKEHIWIKYFNWEKLFEKKLTAPFIPYKKENFDRKYCRITDKIGEETKIRYERYKNTKGFNNLFFNYTFFRNISEEDNAKNKFYNYRNQFKQKRKELKLRNNSTSNLIKDNIKYFKKLNSLDYDSLNQIGSYSYRNNYNSKLNRTIFKKYSVSVNNINKKKIISLKSPLYRKKNILIDNSISNRSFNNSIYNSLKKNDYKQMIKSITSQSFIDYYKKKSENIGSIYRQKLLQRSKQDKANINSSNSFYNLMPSLNNSLIAYNNKYKKNISKSLFNVHNNNLNKSHTIRATLYKNRNNENLSKSSSSAFCFKNKSSYSQKIKEKRNLYFNNNNNLNSIITKNRKKSKNENSGLSNNISSSSNILRQINIKNKNKNLQNPQNYNYYRNRLSKKNIIIKNKLYFEVELNEQYDQYKKKEKNNKQIYSNIENSIKLNGVNNENKIHNVVINNNNNTANIINHNFNSNNLNGKKKKKGLKRSYS